MYKIRLPHKFVMPKVEPHPSDKNRARIHWRQRGKDVAAYRKHLRQFNETKSETLVSSQYVVVEGARRKHEALVTLLQKGTSWLNMYEITVKACEELSRSQGREELAGAAGVTRQNEVFQACEAIQPLPHKFAMPKVEPHASDKKVCSHPLGTEGQGRLCMQGASEAVQ